MLRIIHRAINTHLIKQAGIERKENTHLHALVLDGVYQITEESRPAFIEAHVIHALLGAIQTDVEACLQTVRMKPGV